MTHPATSPAEPIATTIPAAILETILTSLATIFLVGSGGDPTVAREAARQMLAAYHPNTEEEFCLAASIISFSFQALEALGQSAAPDLPLAKILRLRGGAVSLGREADKARRRLAQLQKSQPQKSPPQPAPEPAPVQSQSPSPAVPVKKLTWTQLNQQRERDRRLAARMKKAQAHAARSPSQANPPQFQPAPTG